MEPDENTQKRYYQSLTRNMLLIITIVAIMPMVVVSGIILYQFDVSTPAAPRQTAACYGSSAYSAMSDFSFPSASRRRKSHPKEAASR